MEESIIFKSQAHKEFYLSHICLCRYDDAYHRALVYCLGIDRDTREHAEQIYDFKTGIVKTECLRKRLWEPMKSCWFSIPPRKGSL